MRVLHVISGIDPEHGGPTTALLGMTKAQVKAGLDVSVVSTWISPTGQAHADTFRAAGVKVTMIGPARDPLCRHRDIVPTLRTLIDQSDILHVHGVWEQIQHDACRIARKRCVPYIVTPHGMLSEWNLSQRPLRKKLYLTWRLRKDINGAAGIHFTTEAERKSVAPLGLKAKPFVLALGIDLEEFDPLPARGLFRAKYPELQGKKVVLFLGRLDYKKGLDLLIPAFAQANVPDAVLVLAGPDTHGYGEEMRLLASKEGISDRVIFTGMLRGRARIEALVDADLFALTSYVENFGVAVIEALASGVPLVISDQVNVAERLIGHRVGEIVPTNVPDIQAAVRRLLLDESLRAICSEAIPDALAQFDWNPIAHIWVKLYLDRSVTPSEG